MKLKIKILIIILCTITANCSKEHVSELPYYNSPDFTPHWLNGNESESIHKVASFSFTSQDGEIVTDKSLSGKIYLANFFFTTCPGICPTMTKNLLKVQEKFNKDNEVQLISYSVMPWVDSVSNLKNYEKAFNISGRKWHLVTGSTKEIYELARKSYFAEEEAGFNSDSTEFLHTEHILLVDKKGHLRGVYNGTLPLEIERIIDDINILKKEL
ncbi:MAG: SCO family protein [Ignavibacteria bacterium]|nr:SCO family protein [Ignavibacteria bacterium]